MEGSSKLRQYLRSLGPGLITAALVFGPGSLTVASKLGAGFGYQLLWVIPAALIFMVVFTQMSARIGLASDKSLISLIRSQYGPAISVLTGIGIFLVTASFQAGNSIGAGIAFGELLQTSPVPFILLVSALAISLVFFPSFYQILEKIMIALVAIMLLAFLATLIVVKPSLSGVMGGLIPSLPSGSGILVTAMVASSFSIVGAFYQSYLVREKGWEKNEQTTASRETITAIIILGLISMMVMAAAAAVLQTGGIQVNSAADMGKALEPLFGRFTNVVFMIGLFGASFSSLLGNATIGGSILADSFGLNQGFGSVWVRIFIIFVIVMGAGVAIAFGRLPLELIVFAQGVTILLVPGIGAAILLIAGKKSLMGNLVNNSLQNILGGLGLVILLGLAGLTAYRLFLI